ncbi:hypothetical protein Tcan_14540 [Toxocara canis]|uniref:Uncharacterized protein n=1 Tax=Toxocara canis TaxID=6265 RepID=A0A0B2UUY9_TOXCA|nr:hypothetical protein Tcan_14540 [Toxocara canis]
MGHLCENINLPQITSLSKFADSSQRKRSSRSGGATAIGAQRKKSSCRPRMWIAAEVTNYVVANSKVAATSAL